MSERGSFVTEYMSCPECRKNVIRILTADNGKSFKAQQIEHWSNEEPYLPILAGKVGSSYTNGEVEEFINQNEGCLLYTSPSPRDKRQSRMPSSA